VLHVFSRANNLVTYWFASGGAWSAAQTIPNSQA